jgi:hypothetical protein
MAELNARIIAKASGTTSEEPLAADLEVAELAVNTADGKLFTKHTDGSVVTISGGGGGAVDSVNGETGAVSLGVQDMDDFELFSSTGEFEWPNKANQGDTASNRSCPNPGDWAAFTSGANTYIYLYNDSTSQLLVTGETVTLTIGTGASFTGVISTNTTTQPSWAIAFPYESALDPIRTASAGTSLTVTSLALPTVTTPLAEGDILQWNNADQKFKPAQLSSGAVASVNGETGVVSLGIQEMDDYAANGTFIEVDLGEWDQDVGFDFPDQSGEWRNFDDTSDDVWQLHKRNANQVDYGAELSGLVTGDVVQISTDSGSTYSISVTLIEDAVYSTGNGGNSTISITLSDTDGAKLTGLTAINLRITQPGPPAALVEGDILQWNNSDQKFKPAQLSINSVNGETGVVSLGVQDMDDFELNNTNNPFGPSWEIGTFNDPGKVDFNGSEGRFDPIDIEGTDWSTQLQALTLGGDVWVSSDQGLTWAAVEITGLDKVYNGGVVGVEVSGGWSSYQDCSSPGCSVYFSPVDPGTPTKAPLVEGDILQWNNSDQKFKPAQLPDTIDKATLQAEVAASTDFADFQSRIAAL